jgi:DNA polymerase-4
MAASGRVGRTVTLRLRFDDYERATRSHTLPRSTAASETVLATARELLAAAAPMIARRGVTLVGLAVGNLDGVRRAQLALALDEPGRTAAPGAPPSGRSSQR